MRASVLVALSLITAITLFFGTDSMAAGEVDCGRRAVLVEGTGTYGRSISTDSEEAQAFFDQGLRLTFGFYFPEAIASFQEALCHDPDNPMIHWGLAWAIAPNPNSRYFGFPDDPYGEGLKAIRAAQAHAEGLDPMERGLIDALHVFLDTETHPDTQPRGEAFIEAARKLYGNHPDDLEVGLLYGYAIMTHSPWVYWRQDGTPYPRTVDAARALESVMEREPLHPGATHYYIHLIEASGEPERALPQADRLEAMMPKAGHIVHMPSHIYMRLGRYNQALASNLRSLEADRHFLKVWGDRPFPQIGTYPLSATTHGVHAHDFRRWAAMLMGDYQTAIESARAAAAVPREKWGSGKAQRRITTVVLTELCFGKWAEVLATPQPPSKYPYLRGMWQYARGTAHARNGRVDKARKELRRLQRLSNDERLENLLVMANPAKTILEIGVHVLTGEIAETRDDLDGAIAAYERAVEVEDGLGYMEPPDWAQSVRLHLGEALLSAGQPARAERVFREDLRWLFENPRALKGLVRSLDDQGKETEARVAHRRFEAAAGSLLMAE